MAVFRLHLEGVMKIGLDIGHGFTKAMCASQTVTFPSNAGDVVQAGFVNDLTSDSIGLLCAVRLLDG
jgi:hypothetical protein